MHDRIDVQHIALDVGHALLALQQQLALQLQALAHLLLLLLLQLLRTGAILVAADAVRIVELGSVVARRQGVHALFQPDFLWHIAESD